MNGPMKLGLLAAATTTIVVALSAQANAWNCPPPNADIHCTSDEATYEKGGCPTGSCPTMTPIPTPTPSSPPPVTPTPTPTPSSTSPAVLGPATHTELPFTGGATGLLLLGGVALLVAGGTATAIARKGAHR